MENLQQNEHQVTTGTTQSMTFIPTTHVKKTKNNRLLFERVGDTFLTKYASTLTVVGISRERVSKSYKHLVHCSKCSLDKELFPTPFVMKYQKLKEGRCPCPCSKVYKYSLKQLEILCKRKCADLGLKYKGLIEKHPLVKNTKPILQCKHGVFEGSVLDTFLRMGTTACTLCEQESTRKNSVKCSWRHVPDYVEGISFVLVNGIRKYSYKCKICSHDRYVKEGYCCGTFDFIPSRLCLQGKPSCRCGGRYIGDDRYKLGRVTFIHEDLKNIKYNKVCRGLVYGRCSLHGDFTQKYDSVAEGNKPLCCKPCGWGVIKGREHQTDYLYFMILEDEEECFLKIGRSFCVRKRQDDLDKFYLTTTLYFLQETHENICKYERFYHKVFKKYSTKSGISFGGDGELFDMEVLNSDDFKLLIEDTNFAKAYAKWKAKTSSDKPQTGNSTPPKQTPSESGKPAENGTEKVNVSKPQPVQEPNVVEEWDDIPFAPIHLQYGKKSLYCMM